MCQLTPSEVKGIWSDTYNLYLKYREMQTMGDVLFLEEALNEDCKVILEKYRGHAIAENMIHTVVRILLDNLEERTE